MKRFLSSWLVRSGLILFVVGCGPLLTMIAAASLGLTSDPNPNPIGLGMLAMVTLWPSILMTGIGVMRVLRDGSPEATQVAGASAANARLSLEALIASPFGRAVAGVMGFFFTRLGVTALSQGNRGPAAALVLGVVCFWFCVTGQIPRWFRR